MSHVSRLPSALLALRLGVFIVMIMWTIDKLVRPEHAAGVFANFYQIGGLGSGVFYAIGGAELVLVLLFVVGAFKFWTYGLVTILHAVSTLSSFPQYLHPFQEANLLFFAAWPMLAACIALFMLRDEDTLWTVQLY